MSTSVLLISPTTPPTYHRIVSPTLQIPTESHIAIPVGLLACQRDPLRKQLETTVVSCKQSQLPVVPSNGRKSKKDKSASAEPPGALLEVILHDTILFPEGGGQPSDIGFIIDADSKAWDVVEAKRHGGHAVHYVRVPDNEIDNALISLRTGTTVTVALGEEGFKRRFDHMCMHTSQHLLSAILETKLNLPTLSWSLTASPAPCYVELPRGMSPEEIAAVQEEANKLVFEGRQVHVEVEELRPDNVEKVPKLESGRSVGKGLPSDYTGGVKRVVVIDGVDRNPCCGTHLPSLNNLQLFLLPHTDALARSNTTSARLYFLSGPRLINYITTTHSLLSSTASTLSCGPPLVPERVEQVVDERKKAVKRVEEVELELASAIARDIVSQAPRDLDGKLKITRHLHRTDDSPNALGFLSSISTALVQGLAERKEETAQYLVILSSSPSAQTTSSTSVILIIGSDEKFVKAAGEGLRGKLNVKGGGKGTRWSGKFIGVWKGERQDEQVEEVLSLATSITTQSS